MAMQKGDTVYVALRDGTVLERKVVPVGRDGRGGYAGSVHGVILNGERVRLGRGWPVSGSSPDEARRALATLLREEIARMRAWVQRRRNELAELAVHVDEGEKKADLDAEVLRSIPTDLGGGEP